jgi:hypothetical protein
MTLWINREYTNKIMDAMDNGSIDPRTVADMCLMWMSEREVKDMYLDNDMYEEEEEEEFHDES